MTSRPLLARLALGASAATMLVGGLAACGDDSADEARLRQEALERAREEGAREARTDERTRTTRREAARLRRELEELRRSRSGGSGGSSSGGGGSSSATPGRSCGGGVSVNSNTTCPFAQNVRDEYFGSGGASVIEVHSPVTGVTYTMRCSAGSPHVCTGGNNAAVYFP